MKILFAFTFILSLGTLFGQTPLISHKSHSGSSLNYFIDPNSNFGAIEIFPENYADYRYEMINDSTFVRRLSNGYTIISQDTLANPKKESFMHFTYYDKIKLTRERDSIQYVQDSLDRMEYERLTKPSPSEKNEMSPIISDPGNNQNPPSFLLIFFAVSAVGMIVMRLFRSPVKVSNPIA